MKLPKGVGETGIRPTVSLDEVVQYTDRDL
jgi:hypothetical protein